MQEYVNGQLKNRYGRSASSVETMVGGGGCGIDCLNRAASAALPNLPTTPRHLRSSVHQPTGGPGEACV